MKSQSKEELIDFLNNHCEIKLAANSSATNKKNYIFYTKDCVLFMAEAYIQGMRNAIGQSHEVMQEAKLSGNYSEVIMVYNWSAPEPGIDMLQIPENVVKKLTKEQTTIFVNN
ncbi:MAG: hypothetical protein WCJ33_04090, partial [Pseudomonadota bacterium]